MATKPQLAAIPRLQVRIGKDDIPVLARRFFLSVCVAAGAALVGCGGEGGPALSPVKGVVKYNGNPVQGASVSFAYENGQLAVGATDASGSFSLTTNGRPGAPLGAAKVGINKADAAAGGQDMTTMKPEDMQKMQMDMAKRGAQANAKPPLPIKYQNPEKSGLTADVAAGGAEKNTFEFNLVD